MKIFILINTNLSNPVLGVYDSELLAEKRKLYFENNYPSDELKIAIKNLEYLDRE